MPKFMDFHSDLKLPPETLKSIADVTRTGTRDEFGVRQLEAYHNPEGQVYCLVEAPDAEAVRKHHAALGVTCGDVHPVESLL
ncbi:MAG TPA: nickel-binding protein [Candidatus Micrarchaeia archaeon]|nr:nickel-binding protein [Candidatus Micrarchaeia archaeon]